MKLSLSMIVKDCETTIGRCLESVREAVDEIVILDTGSTDKTKDVILLACPDAVIHDYVDHNAHREMGWISDFAAARNKALSLCTGNVVFWLDADDTLEATDKTLNAAKELRSRLDQLFANPDVVCDVAYMRYDYKHDKYGQCMSRQPRLRVWRTGTHEWEWPVHEDIKPLQHVYGATLFDSPVYVKHWKTADSEGVSALRNLWIMECYQARGGPMNDRMWQNVGSSLAMLGRSKEAVEAFTRGIEVCTHNDETKFIMMMRKGAALRDMRRYEEARDQYAAAHVLWPDREGPCCCLAELLTDMGKFEQALLWCQESDRRNGDAKSQVWNPLASKSVPLYTRARCYTALGRYEDAWACYAELVEMFPGEDGLTAPMEMIGGVLESRRVYDAFLAVRDALADQPEKQRALYDLAPEALLTFPEIAKGRLPPRPAGARTLAIYCGAATAPWGPLSLKQGIGGSEEAVILLSREMVKAGWHVEVYAFPGAAEMGSDEHGVVWAPYYCWDEQRPVDVFVGWRQYLPDGCFRNGIGMSSGKRYLWLHDIVQPPWFVPDLVDRLDGIFCLSKFHAEALPPAAKDKLILSANGLDPSYFVDGSNQPHRFIYASSPDRGLHVLLREWKTIREAIPNAELDIYYGFNRHYLARMGGDPQMRALKDEIEAGLKQPGIFYHGMVGQRELAYAYAKAGFWIFPSMWPETSCISAMKAQAMGAIPITSRFPGSALPETCRFDLGPPARSGSIYDDAEWLAEWTAAVIAATRRDDLEQDRAAMKRQAREEFSWAKVAEQWTALFSAQSLLQIESLTLQSVAV